jgi:class 3 adenylate cyclase
MVYEEVENEQVTNLKHKVAAAESKGDKAKALNLLAQRLMRLGQFQQATSYAEEGLELALEAKTLELQAQLLNTLGDLSRRSGNYPLALIQFEQSLSIFTVLNDKYGVAMVSCNCGTVYKNLSEYPNALEYYNKASAVFEEIGERVGLSTTLGNIGNIYHNIEDYHNALKYHLRALALDEGIGNNSGIATHLGNIGNVYSFLHDYSKALEYFQKALTAETEVGDRFGIAINIGNIGLVYANQNFEGYDLLKAEDYLLRAGRLYEEIGSKKMIYEFHKGISDLYRKQKRWEESDTHFRTYHAIEQEVLSEEAKKQAEQMEYRRKIEEAERDRQVKLARFQEQEKILHNILPSQIADRMIEGEKTIVDSYESVSVLFADIVGFTKLSQRVTPEQLVAGLDGIFNTFDLLADKHGCEKIKTIGDCYMVVAGLPERCNNHPERLGLMALDMLKAIEEFPAIVEDISINMRIGIHSGSVVAGIIGKNKYAYDLWGDAVNTASRMESHGEAGKIHVSEEFRNALISTTLNELPIQFTTRGEMDIKGKGMMKTYFLEKA